jgi:hypothetical protein
MWMDGQVDVIKLIVQLPIRDLVSGTKMLVGFSWNWVEDFIAKNCQTSMTIVKSAQSRHSLLQGVEILLTFSTLLPCLGQHSEQTISTKVYSVLVSFTKFRAMKPILYLGM